MISGSLLTVLSISTLSRSMNMTYVHIPKCGSTFATILLRIACNISAQEPIIEPESYKCMQYRSGHAPLLNNNPYPITMMREPRARIASGFMHNMHDAYALQKKYKLIENNSVKIWHKMLQKMSDTDIQKLFETYAHDVQCCATNMIMGKSCGYTVCKKPLHAIERLRSFHFVGITEQWKRSIETFAKMHGTVPYPIELQDSRVQEKTDLYKKIRSISHNLSYVIDDEVYGFALKNFEKKNLRFNFFNFFNF